MDLTTAQRDALTMLRRDGRADMAWLGAEWIPLHNRAQKIPDAVMQRLAAHGLVDLRGRRHRRYAVLTPAGRQRADNIFQRRLGLHWRERVQPREAA